MMNQYLRFGNAISIEGPSEAYAGYEAEAARRWCVSTVTLSNGSTSNIRPYSGASEDWVVMSPNGSSGRVKFGSTIGLYSMPASGYLSSGDISKIGLKGTHIEPTLGEYQQCEILKHGDPESKDEVRFGDSIILRFKDSYCLSWALAVKMRFGDAAPVNLAPQMTTQEKWLLSPPILISKDVDDFKAVMRSPDNYGKILLTQGISTQQMVAKVAGAVPKAGGLISGLIGVLFPEDTPDIWDKIKGQVATLTKELIFEEKLDGFQNQLGGVKENFDLYLQATRYSEKAEKLGNIIDGLNIFKKSVYKAERPERTLPYLLATGTLHIAALREQYIYSDELFPPGKNDLKAEPGEQKTRHLNELKEKISFYTDAVKKAQQNILNLRSSQITFTSRPHTERDNSGVRYSKSWSFKDSYTGETRNWDMQYESSQSGILERDKVISKEVADYRQDVLTRLDQQLESIIEPMYAWRYMNPEVDELPVKTTRTITFGPFGGSDGYSFSDNPDREPIVGLAMRAGGYVDGVELTYGPRTVGVAWHGGSGGGLMNERLQPGEKIVSVSGRTGNLVDALHFHTNKRIIVGGGGSGGNEFSVKLPEVANPVLIRLFGRSNHYLNAIGFEWEYTRFE